MVHLDVVLYVDPGKDGHDVECDEGVAHGTYHVCPIPITKYGGFHTDEEI